MQTNKLLNADATVVAVTGTATLLSSLIDTAGGGASTFRDNLNAIDLYIEDGDVRVLYDGNTPTAAKGILLKQGTLHCFRGININQLRLIRTGGSNVAVGVQVGYANPQEVSSHASQAQPQAGQDLTNNRQIVEQRFTRAFVQADTLVKSGAGVLHALTFSCNDAAPTAGSIIVYDNTAESGDVIFNHTFTTTPFVPFTVHFDIEFATGLYIGFTTTNDVNVTAAYR